MDAKEYAIQNLRKAFEEFGIPRYMHHGFELYLTDGILPGDFATAVLENDLKGAYMYADSINRELLESYAKLMRWGLPAQAQGSREAVGAWIKQGGLNG